MARKDASLALRKARSINGQLELNQSDMVRLVGILNSANLPPRLSASPELVLASVLAGAPHRSSAMLDGSVVLDAVLASHTHGRGELVGAFVIECTMASTSRAPLPVIAGQYDQNVFRGPASAMGDAWERADSHSLALSSEWQKAGNERATSRSLWQQAAAHQQQVAELGEQMHQTFMANQQRFAEGLPVSQQNRQGYDSLAAGHVANQSLWVEAAPVSSWRLIGFTNPPRFDQVWQADQWQEGIPIGKGVAAQAWHHGKPLIESWHDGWDEAMWPSKGKTPPPEPPKPPIRPDKRVLRLAFGRKRDTAELEFVWQGSDAAIVIPTRRVYLVSNTAKIVRVRDGLDIPATAVSIELDTDSWAWQFSAQIPRIAAAALTDEEEVSIHINGQQWDCVCDGWQSSQSFGRESATLTGRSRTAYLSPTHVLAQAVSEGAAATMAQLAAAVLPVGWTLDWQAADWLVPAGYFSLDNQTPIEVVRYLAEAAGGFVLPHQRNRHLVIKPRYPTVPWQLDTAEADVAIPRAIITTLGSDFQPGHAANGIWVTGGHQGISARVVRQGTAGEQQAPTITHPLVCDVTAARAQGVVGLAKTMPKRTQTIELPLSADTGLILPGALLAVDGWKGYNRGVRVSAALQNRAMRVRQQLSVERFV
ncbi:hypothetical protein [Aeromonas allosaccharophila]|uniref:hypothetical protein n=1 Tax=Aeromonas allosaccharophila TaxID=656 RepID=UPI0036D8B69E